MADKPKNPSFRSDSINTPENPHWRAVWTQHLHTKREKRANGAPLMTPRFDVTLLIPKLGEPDVCPNYGLLLKLLTQAATKANWLTTGQWPQGIFWPIQNGDVPYAQKPPAPGQPVKAFDPNKYKWREKHWIIECTNYFDSGPAVGFLQGPGDVIPLPAQTFNGKTWYKSGDFVLAKIHAFTFNNEKFGLNFGFDGICFVGPGEAIGSDGGPKSAAEMFAGAQGPVGVPAVGAPAPGPQYTAPSPGGPPMPPGPAPAPVYTAPTPPGPVAPAPVLPPMPPGVGAPGALPAFPPR